MCVCVCVCALITNTTCVSSSKFVFVAFAVCFAGEIFFFCNLFLFVTCEMINGLLFLLTESFLEIHAAFYSAL